MPSASNGRSLPVPTASFSRPLMTALWLCPFSCPSEDGKHQIDLIFSSQSNKTTAGQRISCPTLLSLCSCLGRLQTMGPWELHVCYLYAPQPCPNPSSLPSLLLVVLDPEIPPFSLPSDWLLPSLLTSSNGDKVHEESPVYVIHSSLGQPLEEAEFTSKYKQHPSNPQCLCWEGEGRNPLESCQPATLAGSASPWLRERPWLETIRWDIIGKASEGHLRLPHDFNFINMWISKRMLTKVC